MPKIEGLSEGFKNKSYYSFRCFISLLLELEMLSLRRIMMMGTMRRASGSLSLILILMILRVVEAVLRVAILVKLIQWSSAEFILRGLI